jgi:Domain of unknown function (DUF5703)
MRHALVLLFSLFLLHPGPVCAQLVDDLEAYRVVWDTPSQNASESMPLVGGDLGCNLWVEDGELRLYLQRSGCLSENGEYLKLGRVRIALSPNPFEREVPFHQSLDLRNGNIDIRSGVPGEGLTTITCWVDVFDSSVNIAIDSETAVTARASYDNWRFEDDELVDGNGRRERFACFSLEGYPGKVTRARDEIRFEDDGVLFYHRNPKDSLIPGVLITQQGLEAYRDEIFDDIKDRTFGGVLRGGNMAPADTSEGTYHGTPYRSWTIESEAPARRHEITLISSVEQAPDLDAWSKDLLAAARQPRDLEASRQRSETWWNDFWNRSHIIVNSDRANTTDPPWRVGRNYQLFRYQLGGNFRGEYPTKFNGGNLGFDPVLVGSSYTYTPDWRQWGGAVHTAQNQRLLYWPMLKAGDFDAIIPQFELYRKGLPGALARVREHFGHDGAVFTEYMNAPGLVLGAGWGWDARNHRGRGTEIPLGDERAHGARGYNDLVEAGIQANQSCAYHYESQLEHAYMILEYHRFTGADISAYLPFIKASIVFFDEHYRTRQSLRTGDELDDSGKLVIYPSTACETYRGATNPTDLVAGLHACIDGLLALGDDAISPDERRFFEAMRTRVPDYSFAVEEGDTIMLPAASWKAVKNVELPQFYPLFPFDRFRLGDEEISVFRDTYRHAPDFKGMVISWHQDGIFFARMGMVEEAANYTLAKLKDSPRRFPTFWGPGHDWVPDHNWGGSGMIGLQEMALQTIGSDLTILPAWPADWCVDLRLHAPDQTIVELTYDGKHITALEVTPASRTKDVVVPIRFKLSDDVARAFPEARRLR